MLGGYGGQYSFGHAAFFGTGAYVTAILQVRYGINAWIGFACGIAAGAAGRRHRRRAHVSAPACAALISRWSRSPSPKCCASSPASRRSPAAGVGTLIKLDLRPQALQFQSRAAFYWVVLALVAVALVVTRLIERSRFGAWLMAVRENEDAAMALGVDAPPSSSRAMMHFRRHHGRGRLLLRAVFPVRRFRHCLWHLDLDRGAADPDHRRRRHGVWAVARRAGGQRARRGRAAW